jgi:hypothetical protein
LVIFVGASQALFSAFLGLWQGRTCLTGRSRPMHARARCLILILPSSLSQFSYSALRYVENMKSRKPIRNFKNIRVLPSGYQVVLVRARTEFSKHFAGHSERSLRKAERYREQLLRELPDKRQNRIPRRILTALNLKKPVVGVFRHANKDYYQVSYRDLNGQLRSRAFPWRVNGELGAYATAARFRERTIAAR